MKKEKVIPMRDFMDRLNRAMHGARGMAKSRTYSVDKIHGEINGLKTAKFIAESLCRVVQITGNDHRLR